MYTIRSWKETAVSSNVIIAIDISDIRYNIYKYKVL